MVDICHKCNKVTRPNAKFCAACGTRLNADPNSPTTPAPAFVAAKPPPPVNYANNTSSSSSLSTTPSGRAKSAIITPSSTSSSSPTSRPLSTISSVSSPPARPATGPPPPRPTSSPPNKVNTTAKPAASNATSPSSKSSLSISSTSPPKGAATSTSPPKGTSATSPPKSSASSLGISKAAASTTNTTTKSSTGITSRPHAATAAPRPVAVSRVGSTTASPTIGSSPNSTVQRTIGSVRPLSLSAPSSPGDLRASLRSTSSTNPPVSPTSTSTPSTSSPLSSSTPSNGTPQISPRRRTIISSSGNNLSANSTSNAASTKHVSTPPVQSRPISISPSPVRFSAPAQGGAIATTPPTEEPVTKEKATITASLSTKRMPGEDGEADKTVTDAKAAEEAERKRKGTIRAMFASIIRREAKEDGAEEETDSSAPKELKTSSEDLHDGEEPQRRKWFIKKTELSMVGGNAFNRTPRDPNSMTSSENLLNLSSSAGSPSLTPSSSATRAKSATISTSSPSTLAPTTPTSVAAPTTPTLTPEKKEEKKEKKDQRQMVIEEILRTEEDYLRDLDIIIGIRMRMTENTDLREFVTGEDLAAIFSVVEPLRGLNTELNKIFQTGKDGASIGLGFISMAAYFKMYSVYCGNQNKSLDTLIRLRQRKEFQAFLAEEVARPESRSLKLEDFLIKPVQRVCKYPLLLRELIKATPPTHPDAEKLQTAADKIGEIVADVNEKKRMFENLQTMYEVQTLLEESGEEINILDPSRHLIKEGRIGYVPRNKIPTLNSSNPKVNDGYYFLFNNLFLCMKRTVMGSQKLKIYISLDKALIPPRTPFKSELPVFQVVEAGKAVWSFVTSSEEECETLSQLMNKYIEAILKKKYLEEQEKHKANQISFEDFLKSHRDKPLPPPPPPKVKKVPPPPPNHPSSEALIISSPTLVESSLSPATNRRPPLPSKNLPALPKATASTDSIKFICYYHDKRVVELPKANVTFTQLRDKIQTKFSFPPNTFAINRHSQGTEIASQEDLASYLEQSKDAVGVEIDIVDL